MGLWHRAVVEFYYSVKGLKQVCFILDPGYMKESFSKCMAAHVIWVKGIAVLWDNALKNIIHWRQEEVDAIQTGLHTQVGFEVGMV